MSDPNKTGEEGGAVTADVIKKLHEQYLRNLKLQGVEGIRKAFIREVRMGRMGRMACMAWHGGMRMRLCNTQRHTASHAHHMRKQLMVGRLLCL